MLLLLYCHTKTWDWWNGIFPSFSSYKPYTAFCVLKFNLLSCRFRSFFGVIEYSILIPCKQRFLSSMTFSICKVIRMACQSCSWFVYALRETSARSHLWFPLSMHFRHLHNLEELLFNTELNTTAAGIRCLFKKKI